MTEVTVLYGAIAALFVALTTIAKLTWDERGKRVESAEAQATYYREEIPVLLSGIITAQQKQDESMGALASVVERNMARTLPGGSEVMPR